jgi:hypothetical protein
MRGEDHILLLEVGGEGGSLRLVLEMTDIGVFSFRLLDDSCESSFFSKEDLIQPKLDFADKFAPAPGPEPLIIDWPGALKLLDEHRWPWPSLYPMFVHPSIRSLVVVALKNRYQRYPEIHLSSWERDFGGHEKGRF